MMKTADRRFLQVVKQHKEYFDSRLIDIASEAECKIKDLESANTKLKDQCKDLTHELSVIKIQTENKDKKIKTLRFYLQSKQNENDELQQIIEELKNEVEEMHKEREQERKRYEELVKKNEELHDEINKKLRRLSTSNSTNSNMPSSFNVLSHTVSKANANTRIQSGKNRGGQKGHVLHKNKLSNKPDQILIQYVQKAPSGAVEGRDEDGNTYYATQNIDIKLMSKITETRYYLKKDGEALDKSIMNKYKINPVAYTNHFKAVTIYLNQVGTIPLYRLSDMVYEISDSQIRIKPSTIVNWNREFHEKSYDTRRKILEDITNQDIVHVDETGFRVNTSMYWVHTITNNAGSHINQTKKRGDKENGPVGLLEQFEGVAVHDHFRAYQDLKKCVHAECNAHIERYLKSGIEIDKSKECQKMLDLLHEMLRRKKELTELNISQMDEKEILDFEDRYVSIAKTGLEKYYATHKEKNSIYIPEYIPTFKRMIEYKEDHLRFIKDFKVPYTNNAAERQCRVVKTKKKTSGHFVSETGLESYTDVLTIVQTAKIRHENALENLEKVFR